MQHLICANSIRTQGSIQVQFRPKHPTLCELRHTLPANSILRAVESVHHCLRSITEQIDLFEFSSNVGNASTRAEQCGRTQGKSVLRLHDHIDAVPTNIPRRNSHSCKHTDATEIPLGLLKNGCIKIITLGKQQLFFDHIETRRCMQRVDKVAGEEPLLCRWIEDVTSIDVHSTNNARFFIRDRRGVKMCDQCDNSNDHSEESCHVIILP